jgi:hypothetical protein
MKLAEIHGNYKSQLITLQFRSPQYLPIHIPCHYMSAIKQVVQNVFGTKCSYKWRILHQDIHCKRAWLTFILGRRCCSWWGDSWRVDRSDKWSWGYFVCIVVKAFKSFSFFSCRGLMVTNWSLKLRMPICAVHSTDENLSQELAISTNTCALAS